MPKRYRTLCLVRLRIEARAAELPEDSSTPVVVFCAKGKAKSSRKVAEKCLDSSSQMTMLNAHVKFWDGPLFLNMEKNMFGIVCGWRSWRIFLQPLGIWIWISNEGQQITSVAPDLWRLLCWVFFLLAGTCWFGGLRDTFSVSQLFDLSFRSLEKLKTTWYWWTMMN